MNHLAFPSLSNLLSQWFSSGKLVSFLRSIIAHIAFILGASRVRQLPPEQFCKHGFVMGKSSEAGFGNEMYKILTAGALSIMLNRSLIIGQTRHVRCILSLFISIFFETESLFISIKYWF